jgi:hypothetical protein
MKEKIREKALALKELYNQCNQDLGRFLIVLAAEEVIKEQIRDRRTEAMRIVSEDLKEISEVLKKYKR